MLYFASKTHFQSKEILYNDRKNYELDCIYFYLQQDK